jgi:hypothetical protein
MFASAHIAEIAWVFKLWRHFDRPRVFNEKFTSVYFVDKKFLRYGPITPVWFLILVTS